VASMGALTTIIANRGSSMALPVAFAVVMNTSQPSVDWIGASRWLGVAPLFLNS